MTDRERQYAALGFEYAEGIERCKVIPLPSGREVRRKGDVWEVQPWNDNYWLQFPDLLDAIKAGIKPFVAEPEYASNRFANGAELMLLRRLRRVIERLHPDEGCQLSNSELVANSLAHELEKLGASGHVNAAMLNGHEPEPD